MSVSLYRKYRPQTFADVIGQVSAVAVLTNSISRNRVGHAYLFSGSRGCGKTSAARIFAKALNCTSRDNFEPCGTCRNCTEITAGESLDVIEIDGASNNGVDNIRGLKENVTLSPFNSRYKIYIIDEVHMLSQGAFNALLKTLEEPPEHVIFIMATTEPHKVPVTIRSRCQHIPFRSITPADIFTRLEYVCNQEGIAFEPDALREVSRQADGALRDALSLLEQVSASGNVTLANVEAILGAGSRPAFERWIVAFRNDRGQAFMTLRNMLDGASPVRVFEEMFTLLRDMLIAANWGNAADALNLSEPEKMFLADEVKHWKIHDIHRLMRLTLRILTQARTGMKPDILLGMFMIDAEPSPVNSTVAHTSPVNNATHTSPVSSTVTNLKDDLLSRMHERSFLMWCAMLDVNPSVRGNDLVLDVAHRYCYSVMKNEQLSPEISSAFSEYSSVILRYRDEEYICPRKHQAPAVPVTVPEITVTAPEITQPSAETDKPSSSIGEILRGLASYGLKPEIIQHIQTDSEDTDTDTLEGETDE
ncbi:MAG: DNA polymerase III subunit gamma/tau [Synergistaceae bacterium]|nr:DNA polymerase III subunit gamma/tau [Synergistaceae bacterium]